LFELVEVQPHGTPVEPDGVAVRAESILSTAFSEYTEGFVQRMPGGLLRFVAPQERDEMLPRPIQAWRPRQIDQQGQMLPPQKFWRCGFAIDRHFHGTERSTSDHD
jgi:hypothetical protein